jgi:hypothetical protein
LDSLELTGNIEKGFETSRLPPENGGDSEAEPPPAGPTFSAAREANGFDRVGLNPGAFDWGP